MYKSETSKVRASLAPWCQGYGIDVGHGGDKIVPHAIAVDLPIPYAACGSDAVQLGGDARNLYWFQDSVLDFVYSSHLLEDFEDPVEVFNELVRVLKVEGVLILYLPDEALYRAYCEKTGQTLNLNHKHPHFSSSFIKDAVKRCLYSLQLVYESPLLHDYSFAHVYKKKCGLF